MSDDKARTPDKEAPQNIRPRCFGCSRWVRPDQDLCDRCWKQEQDDQRRDLEGRWG